MLVKNTTFQELDLFLFSGDGVGDTYTVGSKAVTSIAEPLRLALSNGPNRAGVSQPLT
jgi:hypothetical protein